MTPLGTWWPIRPHRHVTAARVPPVKVKVMVRVRFRVSVRFRVRVGQFGHVGT